MKKRFLLFVVVAGLLSITCNNKTGKGTPAAADTLHNSANSVDWQGTYKGTMPCADCPGILTKLTLNNNNSYFLKTKYLGRDSIAEEESGNFSWNKEGNTLTLATAKDRPTQYKVGEYKITQLDRSGKTITGALAENYVLTKQSKMDTEIKSNAELVETYWKLTELMGKPVARPAPGVREMHIILKEQDNRIQAFAGCNNIMGSYELKDGNFISFQGIASTKMACPDMSIENQLLEVLGRTDNYSILGDKLSLNKARMAPLARFEAVYH